ncbi:MAG TPA: SDR family NAD(P)-dependent oxidoreductase, partial [Candidatus Binatia bacterium]|nr:SDR family NAD(P)-dependent oxidoreductase [Candidatus Binatia bacterium]
MALEGRVALVTGASRGIGRAIALALGQAGAYVVLNYRGNQNAAEESLASITAQGGRGELCQFDIATENQVAEAVKKIIDGHQKIDIL